MIFGANYAEVYDLFYDESMYRQQCIMVNRFLQEASCKVRNILDLGCGTGRNAVILKSLGGYDICGVDQSAEMIRIFKERLPRDRTIVGDMATFHTAGPFDGAVMLGDIISYQLTNDLLQKTFENIRHHLHVDAPFIFDAWYGPAVLEQKPRTRILRAGDTLRVAEGRIDERFNQCSVDYTFWSVANGQLDSFNESHKLRYLFAPEVELFLKLAGFQTLHIGKSSNPRLDPTTDDWHFWVVAKAV